MVRLGCVVFALALVACSEPNVLTEGEVIGREYDDPDTWTSTYCAGYGQYGCSVWVPTTNHDGPHWYVDIVGLDDDGEQRTETHEVTQTLYDMADNGVYINLDDGSIVAR